MGGIRAPRSFAGKLATAAAAGAVVGGGPVFLLDPTGPFVAYGSLLLGGVGALTALTGVGAGLAVGPSRRGHAHPWVLEVVAAAVVGGAVATLLLMAISSTVVVVGGILAAALCAALTWWLDRRPAAAEVVQTVP